MRIGIVTDIHEAVEQLQAALTLFQREQVDQVVSIGDACDTFSAAGRTNEVAAMLEQANAIGVWGNHDVGLCFDVPETLRERASPTTLAYMATMQPYLCVADARFSHVEPWLDAHRVEDLWYFDGPPDTLEKAARSFQATTERVLFVGHFHRWLVTTPQEQLSWTGEAPLALDPAQRYLIVVAPVVSGWCAIYDSTASQLWPFRL